MATLALVRHAVNCDGCLAIFGDRRGFESGTEARAAAYAAGWRFPNQPTVHGKPGGRTFDVCPGCISTWDPDSRGFNPARQLSMAEVASLPPGGREQWALVKGYHDSGTIDGVYGPYTEAYIDWLLSGPLEYHTSNWTKVKLSTGPEAPGAPDA